MWLAAPALGHLLIFRSDHLSATARLVVSLGNRMKTGLCLQRKLCPVSRSPFRSWPFCSRHFYCDNATLSPHCGSRKHGVAHTLGKDLYQPPGCHSWLLFPSPL